jgi:hypothetical protein
MRPELTYKYFISHWSAGLSHFLLFRKACELAGIEPTKRQASKWRNDKGLAKRFANAALSELERKARQKLPK